MGDKNKNLISLADRTPEERAAICSAGGQAAAKKRAERKSFREDFLEALSIIEDEKLGKTAQAMGITAIMQRYKRGDLKAFELIRDTIGESPKQASENTEDIENLAALADLLNVDDDD